MEAASPIENCRDYRASTKFGRITIQQEARGPRLQWGAYPKVKYTRDSYKVTVRFHRARFDAKDQNHAPHGSVPRDKARKASGKIMQVQGSILRGGRLVLDFMMQCRVLSACVRTGGQGWMTL